MKGNSKKDKGDKNTMKFKISETEKEMKEFMDEYPDAYSED